MADKQVIEVVKKTAPPETIEKITSKIDFVTKESVSKIEAKITALEGKFDVWQGLVEPMLSNVGIAVNASEKAMETAMQYDTILLAVAAFAMAVAGLAFTKWVSTSKKEAIDEAIKSIKKETEVRVSSELSEAKKLYKSEMNIIHEELLNGILPENSDIRFKIVDTVIKSKELKAALDFRFDNKQAEEAKTEAERARESLREETIKQQSGYLSSLYKNLKIPMKEHEEVIGTGDKDE